MIIDEIALSMHRGISLKTAVRLIDIFGNASSLFSATKGEIIERAELRPDIATDIVSKICHTRAEQEIGYCRKNNMIPVGVSSADYPPLLRECCDYPMVVYVIGNTTSLTGEMLGVVGTRKITPYGAAICEKIIGGIADSGERLTILSGLAYGVDSAAHRAALACGLPTVAVLGNKLPRIYPADHTSLAGKIIESGGALVSELHSGSHEGRMNFVARNRIIAGMSRGTLIVESPDRGGSMITAELAGGYDRAVMAVPGRATDENSAGTNRLIRLMKAACVSSASEVIYELGIDTPRINKPEEPRVAVHVNTGNPIYDLVAACPDGASVDYISDRTGMPASEIMASLFALELEGAVRKAPGGMYFKM